VTFAGGMESSQASFMSGPKNLWNRGMWETRAVPAEHQAGGEPGA